MSLQLFRKSFVYVILSVQKIFAIPLVAILVSLFFGSTGFTQITVDNFDPHSTVRYPVVLLKGNATGEFENASISNSTPRSGAGEIRPVYHDGKFKALVELSEGENIIRFIGSGNKKHEFTIIYQPQTNPYYVRMVWMTDNSGNAQFATPDDSYSQDYESRLRTAAELMQCYTAERMNEMGFGRKTFRLERDDDGKVVVHTWKSPKPAERYYQMSGQNWYFAVNRWLNMDYPDDKAKNIVLAAYTRKDVATGKVKGHTALGSGNLGLFGSASIFSWPTSIEATAECFLDSTKFDTTGVNDDSVGRSNVWGLASTTIGATLHEMGHSFGLMHVQDPKGIMRRGFDHFNRTFTFYDPPSGVNRQAVYFTPENESRFAKISATMLQWSRWFQLDEKSFPNSEAVVIKYDASKDELSVNSEHGVPWVGFLTGTFEITAYREFGNGSKADAPVEVTLDSAELDKILAGQNDLQSVTVIDCAGNISFVPVARKSPKSR